MSEEDRNCNQKGDRGKTYFSDRDTYMIPLQMLFLKCKVALAILGPMNTGQTQSQYLRELKKILEAIYSPSLLLSLCLTLSLYTLSPFPFSLAVNH
jgi:uncharacterized membrane protein YqgA involved in biofilm formation